MIWRFSVLVAGLLFHADATTSDLCPATRPGIEWTGTCFEVDHDSRRRVKQRYMKRLRLNPNGYTTVMISEPRELVAVDRHGKVVVPGIMHTGDADFPTAYGGIGRFVTRADSPEAKVPAQCGYFDSRRFRIVVPAEYDHCKPFADGEAIACKTCKSFCTEPDCNDYVLVGGEGVILALDGTVRRRFMLPQAEPNCTQTFNSENAPARQNAALRCTSNTEDPFKQLE